jgi:sec-independent protein translocase protein TatC
VSLSEQLQSFLPHLNELRSRLLKALGVFVVAVFLCFNYANSILSWLIKPAGHLVFTSPGGGFSAVMTITVVMAFLISAPFTLYQLWAFVASALRPQERRLIFIFGPISLLFFIFGVLFAFFVGVPLAYKFLMSFTSADLTPMVTVDSYLSFLGSMIMAFGITFELPLVLAFLAKIGIVTPEFLRQKRRHAIIIILIIAAVATPPDVVSQLLLALPLLVLYEVGIFFTQVFRKINI